MKVHFPVDSECALREVFAKFHEELGYPKILSTGDAFPDYILEDKEGKRIRAEAELRSSNFDHLLDGCDLIICWEDDRGWEKPTLELRRYVEVSHKFAGFENGAFQGIAEFVNKYDVILNKTKKLLEDIEGAVFRKDHKSVSGKPQVSSWNSHLRDVPLAYFVRFAHKGWKFFPVNVEINFDKGDISICGDIWAEKFKDMDDQKWKRISETIQERGLIFEQRPYGTANTVGGSNIDLFLKEIKEPNRVSQVALAQRLGFDALYKDPSEIIEGFSSTILWLLSLFEEERLYIE